MRQDKDTASSCKANNKLEQRQMHNHRGAPEAWGMEEVAELRWGRWGREGRGGGGGGGVMRLVKSM